VISIYQYWLDRIFCESTIFILLIRQSILQFDSIHCHQAGWLDAEPPISLTLLLFPCPTSWTSYLKFLSSAILFLLTSRQSTFEDPSRLLPYSYRHHILQTSYLRKFNSLFLIAPFEFCWLRWWNLEYYSCFPYWI
jgi:hypothetical protein